MSVVNGLHEFLADDAGLAAAAAAQRRHDPRRAQDRAAARSCTSGAADPLGRRAAHRRARHRLRARQAHDRALPARGLPRGRDPRPSSIFTGQTGWMQGAPFGFILDSMPNDFVSGELEHAIVSCWEAARPELILLEGQSALRNPSGPVRLRVHPLGRRQGRHPPARARRGRTTRASRSSTSGSLRSPTRSR